MIKEKNNSENVVGRKKQWKILVKNKGRSRGIRKKIERKLKREMMN